MSYTLHIVYGSESGNANFLAYDLKKRFSQFSPSYYSLSDLSLDTLQTFDENDLLLVITSTTGDGEPPENAKKFYHALIRNRMTKKIKLSCQFAVFGLGDVTYDNFCGFSIMVDGLLRQAGATSFIPRVDADVDYDDCFEEWSERIGAFLHDERV